MAPEQITDFAACTDRPSDQYSAGAMLYYLLTRSRVHDSRPKCRGSS